MIELLNSLVKLIVNNWRLALFVLFVSLFGLQTYRIGLYQDDYSKLNNEYAAFKAAIRDKMAQSLTEAQSKTIALQNQKIESENAYAEKIKTLKADNVKLDDVIGGLSKQLNRSSDKLVSVTKDTAIRYSRTQNELFTRCVSEYKTMAGYADQERAERLRIVELYQKAYELGLSQCSIMELPK